MSSIPTLLAITSSPRKRSVSTRMVEHFIEHWRSSNPDGVVLRRDLIQTPPAYPDDAWIQAAYTPTEERTEEQRGLLAASDVLVQELLSADTLVLGCPMWNLGIPAVLKAWLDQVVRLEQTFDFRESGLPLGLLSSRLRVVVLATRGGIYQRKAGVKSTVDRSPMLHRMVAFLGVASAYDFQEPYLRTLFQSLGVRDFEFLAAEGQYHMAAAEEALPDVLRAVEKLV